MALKAASGVIVAIVAAVAIATPAGSAQYLDSFGDATLLLQHQVVNRDRVADIDSDKDEDDNVINVSGQEHSNSSMRGEFLGVQQKHFRALSLQHGDKVAVRIERGSKSGTWVPGYVAKNHSGGYYSVRVAIGPKDRYETETFVGGTLLRKANQAVFKTESDYYIANPAAAREVVGELERDHDRRLRLHLHASGLSVRDVRERMAARESSKKQRMERAMWEKGCPPGYQAVDGDARGGDHFGRGMTNKQDTLELCAEECSGKNECLSFEWSPTRKTCNLNKVSVPERHPHFMDFIFCQRAPPGAPPVPPAEHVVLRQTK